MQWRRLTRGEAIPQRLTTTHIHAATGSLCHAANHAVQLTPALDQLRQDYGLTGHVLQGERYDIGGAPTTYLDTLNAFAHSATSLAAGGQFAETPGAEPAQKRAKR